MRCALVSMDSTMRSNATVGPPIELLFYKADSLAEPARYAKLDEMDPYLVELRRGWDENIRTAFNALPPISQLFASGE
jgi:putative proteasome-type protease